MFQSKPHVMSVTNFASLLRVAHERNDEKVYEVKELYILLVVNLNFQRSKQLRFHSSGCGLEPRRVDPQRLFHNVIAFRFVL